MQRVTVNGVTRTNPDARSQWILLDPETGRSKTLGGYPPFSLGHEGQPQRAEFIKVGDHIVGVQGELYLADGSKSRLPRRFPWGMLEHRGRGFVAGDFNSTVGKVWYFERRAAATESSGIKSGATESPATEARMR